MEGLLFVAVLVIGAIVASFRAGSDRVNAGLGVAALVFVGSLAYALF